MTYPRGIRNNNPGNLIKSEAKWRGKVDGDDPRFESFDTPHNGLRALAKQLLIYQDKYGLKTIREIINRWAPSIENDTDSYENAVSTEVGLGVDYPLDLHVELVLEKLVTAIVHHENGQQPYSSDQIKAAVQDALGYSYTQPAAPIEERSPVLETPMPDDSPSFDWGSVVKVGGAIASFFNPLIGVAISALGPVVEQKIEKAVGRHTDDATAKTVANQLSTAIQDSLIKATGKTDPVAAVAEVRANPAVAQTVAAAVEQKLVDMTPLLNEMHRQAQERFAAEMQDRNAASERVAKVGWNIQQYLVIGGIAITSIIVVSLLTVMIIQVASTESHLPDATLIAFAGPILVLAMRGLGEAYAFAFGGTQEGSPGALAKGAAK